MGVKISSAKASTGVIIPKTHFRAIPARGPAKVHIDRYGASYWSADDEPLKYATVKRAFALLSETGVLARLDQLCFMAMDEAGSLLNWVALGLTPSNNGMPFGTKGFESNGVGYIDTGFNPTTAASPKYQLNAAHVGIYISDNVGPTTSGNVALGHTGTARTIIYPLATAANTGYRINSGATNNFSGNPYHGHPGFLLVNRAGANTTRMLHDGNLIYSAGSDAAAGLPATNLTIARSGTTVFGGGKYAGWSIGNSLSVGGTFDQEQALSQAMTMLALAMLPA